ncbi:hypothetical protein [Trinickia violacea]|uniref:hypothetical protein n=1 Tax=Trinickia violacea TaxID=2571746 RepID=UPI0020C7C206|nr:hypothetical protein [Trinickia violacea]
MWTAILQRNGLPILFAVKDDLLIEQCAVKYLICAELAAPTRHVPRASDVSHVMFPDLFSDIERPLFSLAYTASCFLSMIFSGFITSVQPSSSSDKYDPKGAFEQSHLRSNLNAASLEG